MTNKYNFCHLHRHCESSIQDGVGKVEDGVIYAKEMGHPAVAITDHGSLISYVRLYNEAKRSNIKHIFGLEAYLVDDMNLKDKEHRNYNHCTILVKNKEGYKNLIKLNNIGHRDGYYYKPRIDWNTLFKHKQGLIILSGCVIGRTCQYILDKKYSEADAWTRMMKEQLGEDYYIEFMVSDFPEQATCNKYLLELSRKFNIPGVVTADAHYTRKEDYEAQKAMMLLSSKATIAELEEQQRKRAEAEALGQTQEEKDKIWIFESDQYWMKNENEMIEAYQKWHSTYYPFNEFESHLNESGKIAEKVEVIEMDTAFKIPKATIPGVTSYTKHFEDELWKALKERGLDTKQEYVDRLKMEIDIIKEKNLVGYFLINRDVIGWAKRNDIFVGPGRGSAGGSLVCYLFNITELDPIRHGLLFERFLDIGRQEMPDIDTDFEIDRRDEVKQYMADKYGTDHVANIIALGTFHARNITRDVARIYGHDPKFINEISKLIREDCYYRDNQLFDINDEEFHHPILDKFFRENPQIAKISSTLYGQIRHVSKHAAGVIISDKPLDECVPLFRVGEECMTAWTDGLLRKEFAQLNFLKFDILGLKTLSIIKHVCKQIGIDYRKLKDLDLNDDKVYRAIVGGKLIKGVFQFDSNTGGWLFNHMSPKNFEDLISLGALDRPGPLDSFMAFEYVDRMHNIEPVEQYTHPAINEVLKNTFGVIVFQEQLMMLAKNLSLFTSIEASNLRKNLVKGQHSEEAIRKQRDQREVFKKKFIEGAVANGSPQSEAEKLWNAMVKFARYGFNRAHSVGYAYVSFWTMWLKTYYPVQFYTSLLSYSSEDDIPYILDEMRSLTIDLVTPDINRSTYDFTADPDRHKIIYGLSKIKYVGTKAQEAIIAGRPFKSFEDLCERIPKNVLNKRAKEALIRSGAFISLEPDTSKLLAKLEYDGLSKKQQQLWVDKPRFYSEAQRAVDEETYLGVAISRELKLYKRPTNVERQYRTYLESKDGSKFAKIKEKLLTYNGTFKNPESGLEFETFGGRVKSIAVGFTNSGHERILIELELPNNKTERFYVMHWNKVYKDLLTVKADQYLAIAITKRTNPSDFANVTHSKIINI